MRKKFRHPRSVRSVQVLRVLIVVVAVGTIPLPGRAAASMVKFDPDGSFWIHGTPPDEFKDFSAINLNAKKLRRLPSPGLQLNDGKNFRFKVLSVSRANFSFATTQVGAVSYSFTGHFLKGGVFAAADLDEKTPVLEGVLRKYKSGKKVAEASLKFTYFGGT